MGGRSLKLGTFLNFLDMTDFYKNKDKMVKKLYSFFSQIRDRPYQTETYSPYQTGRVGEVGTEK